MPHCCWGLCNSDSKYGTQSKRPRDDMIGVFFVPFPKPKTQLERCKKWIKLCGNAKLTGPEVITPNYYVCSKHFVGGNGPTPEHPDPVPAIGGEIERSHALRMNRKRPPPKLRDMEAPKQKKDTEADEEYAAHGGTGHSEDIVPVACTSRPASNDVRDAGTCAETQTELMMTDLSSYSDEQLKDKKALRRKFISDMTRDDRSCKFYTGLSLLKLSLVFSLLKDKASRLSYWKGDTQTTLGEVPSSGPSRTLSLWEEFLVMLLCLRRGLDVEHLADIFGVSASTISRTFTTWISFCSRELSFLVRWPTREQVRRRRPTAFKYFPRTRCIIDCTEFYIQRPSLPTSQRKTWSSYKSHNTFKALVATTPRGSICYLSPLWTGSISDRAIVKQSGFLEFLEQDDDVMADRGFLVRDLLALRGATLNIPPFAHGRQLAPQATTKTRRIARARIHVERAIGRLKQFCILQGVIPLKRKRIINDVVKVCAYLCNLDKFLVQ